MPSHVELCKLSRTPVISLVYVILDMLGGGAEILNIQMHIFLAGGYARTQTTNLQHLLRHFLYFFFLFSLPPPDRNFPPSNFTANNAATLHLTGI